MLLLIWDKLRYDQVGLIDCSGRYTRSCSVPPTAFFSNSFLTAATPFRHDHQGFKSTKYPSPSPHNFRKKAEGWCRIMLLLKLSPHCSIRFLKLVFLLGSCDTKGVTNPRCPGKQGVTNPWCPGHQGVTNPWCLGPRGVVFLLLRLFSNFKLFLQPL